MCPTHALETRLTRPLCSLPGGSEHPDRIRLAIRTHTPYHRREHGAEEPEPASMAIIGELDRAAARTVEECCMEYVDRLDVAALVVDASGIELIDSGGLGLLARLDEAARRRNGYLLVCDPSVIVRRAIDALGVDLAIASPDSDHG